MKKVKIKGMAHITGGGFIENIPRMFFKKGLCACIDRTSYPVPRIYQLLNERGVELNHMYNTFNMGIGFVICVNKKDVKQTLNILRRQKEHAYQIGYVKKANQSIELI
jgi:phosphoribosylformylglycinamidine cyclo-ligase